MKWTKRWWLDNSLAPTEVNNSNAPSPHPDKARFSSTDPGERAWRIQAPIVRERDDEVHPVPLMIARSIWATRFDDFYAVCVARPRYAT